MKHKYAAALCGRADSGQSCVACEAQRHADAKRVRGDVAAATPHGPSALFCQTLQGVIGAAQGTGIV